MIYKQNKKHPEASEGKKYDNGKPMIGTIFKVFPHALTAIGQCIEFGTHKYPDPENWKKVEGAADRYRDSLARHLTSHILGEIYNDETAIINLAHMAWNALAICELAIMERNGVYRDEELWRKIKSASEQ